MRRWVMTKDLLYSTMFGTKRAKANKLVEELVRGPVAETMALVQDPRELAAIG
jgi:hypothetical protein